MVVTELSFSTESLELKSKYILKELISNGLGSKRLLTTMFVLFLEVSLHQQAAKVNLMIVIHNIICLLDLQMVNISLRVLSRPIVQDLPVIYQTLGTDYDERVLPSIVNEVLKSVVVSQIPRNSKLTFSGTIQCITTYHTKRTRFTSHSF